MSFESRVFDLITTLRKEVRTIQTVVDGLQSAAGTAASSETVPGILEIATQAETNSGTDNTRAITPLKFQTRLAAYAQPLSANLNTLSGIVSGAMGRTLLAAADAATAKTSLGLVKSDVGLANVDNTSDINKPVSTSQQNALNLKADTTALPTKTSLGLANVDNTSDINKPVSTPQQTALNLKADATALPTKTSLGLGNVDNTSDINKPVSNAQQTALNLKADITALPTKSSLGLGNVDNTSDINKPVSTAQQTVLNSKAGLYNGGLAATPLIISPESGYSSAIPYYMNDIAFNRKRGGAVRVYYDGVQQADSGTFDYLFDPTSNAINITTAGITTIVIEVDMCVGATYGTKFGYAVNEAWRAKDVKIEVYRATPTPAWTTILDVTGVTYGEKVVSFGGSPDAVTKIRYTFSNWNTTAFRMGQLFVLRYNSDLGTAPFVDRSGGSIYGALNVAGNLSENGNRVYSAINAPPVPTKAAIGLGNVDNTSDVNKPISTAQQTALSAKADLASPSLTGVPTAPTAPTNTNTTQLATTAFVQAVGLSGLAMPSTIDGGTP